MGKRLLRSLALAFGCIAVVSLVCDSIHFHAASVYVHIYIHILLKFPWIIPSS